MKTYLLLRNNHETGPHTLEELKALSLRNLDLIWEEGKSQHWDFATEFEELKPFIKTSTQTPRRPISLPRRKSGESQPSKVFVALPTGIEIAKKDPSGHALRAPETVTHFEQPLSELKERYNQQLNERKFSFQKHMTRGNSTWILALMCMLVFGAYIVKSMVDDESTSIVAAGSSIMPIQSLPEGTVAEKPAASEYQNAISKQETPAIQVKKAEAKKPLNWKELKKQVSISNNKYKVGLFGGVDDLQLNIRNSSTQTLDKVNVQVTFLKPNGQRVRMEEYSVYAVDPKTTKILVVPSSKRGVNVKYKIIGVESKGEKIRTGEV